MRDFTGQPDMNHRHFRTLEDLDYFISGEAERAAYTEEVIRSLHRRQPRFWQRDTKLVNCPLPGHRRGWWAWGPWLASFVIVLAAVVTSLIPWQAASVLFFVLGCIGVGVSYFHVACHFSASPAWLTGKSKLHNHTHSTKKEK